MFQEYQPTVAEIETFGDVLRIIELDDIAIELAYSAVCPDTPDPILGVLPGFDLLLNSLFILLPESSQTLDQNFCDERILVDLLNWAVDAVLDIVVAEDSLEIRT